MTRQTKRAIFILVFSEFLVCLGISLVIPVMPFIKNELHLTATDMGIMNALFAAAQFIASPIIGRVSDKIGRKPVLAVGLFLYMVSEVLFALTNHLWVFNISRIIGGLSAAMVVPTAMALASDITTKRQRAKVIGWLSAAFSGGLILGPGIGGILAGISYKTPFWVAGALGLLSAIVLIVLLPSDADTVHHLDEEAAAEPSHHPMSRAFWTLPIIILFTMILVSSFGLQGFESIYSIYVNEVFKFSLSNIALVLTLNGLISLFLQVALFDTFVQRFGEQKVIRVCFALAAICTIWITQAHTKWEVVVATLVIFSAFDLLRPAITTLLTKASDSNQGLINGLNMSLTSVGNIVGPIMSGMLLDMNYHYPYIVVAVFLIVSYLMAFLLRLPAKAKPVVKS
ncbi:MFS transporter [Lactiplantibacillus fabifermentans]|uniref:MFS family major facilitator transporter n=2 Tax=Lactiplantibacillus fabifermentans TaxID=483011 RepID=A0A0R2NL96_9LACO|nr:tetracycline resistance MFS efflux pump [Lactiplantibacillus fabifermentans]ETY75168.1 MFS transporter [Lactiplantibacillus fabifermentans T30PCM01]KRO26501.1 MFS family major facilitator transporter [Lactiplantibacillus fabifermentans DSM 21115]